MLLKQTVTIQGVIISSIDFYIEEAIDRLKIVLSYIIVLFLLKYKNQIYSQIITFNKKLFSRVQISNLAKLLGLI